MYGVEVNATRANYYLPVQDGNGDIPPCKKRCESTSPTRRTVHILGRRYALTPTSFKYLEIGISVGPVSTVLIVLGDNRSNQLVLHTETWGGLMAKRDDILQLLQTTETSSPLWIRDLAVECCTKYGAKLLKLTLFGNYLYLQPATVEYLFTFEHCIDHMYSWLFENTHIVNTKFRNFVKILREKNIIEMSHAATAIRESSDFDSGSLIDCELLACAVKDILYEAVNK